MGHFCAPFFIFFLVISKKKAKMNVKILYIVQKAHLSFRMVSATSLGFHCSCGRSFKLPEVGPTWHADISLIHTLPCRPHATAH